LRSLSVRNPRERAGCTQSSPTSIMWTHEGDLGHYRYAYGRSQKVAHDQKTPIRWIPVVLTEERSKNWKTQKPWHLQVTGSCQEA
jgi:hypothetical protein